jgi:acyl-CoA reductase-like NAD-dependent aldehyde dehydrogenase
MSAFTQITSRMTIHCDEILGPIKTAIPVRVYDKVLVNANNTETGLCSWIATQSTKLIPYFRYKVGASIQVNLPTAGMNSANLSTFESRLGIVQSKKAFMHGTFSKWSKSCMCGLFLSQFFNMERSTDRNYNVK